MNWVAVYMKKYILSMLDLVDQVEFLISRRFFFLLLTFSPIMGFDCILCVYLLGLFYASFNTCSLFNYPKKKNKREREKGNHFILKASPHYTSLFDCNMGTTFIIN